jgi:hypothetical protein
MAAGSGSLCREAAAGGGNSQVNSSRQRELELADRLVRHYLRRCRD